MKLFISKDLKRYFGYQIQLETVDENTSKLIISNCTKEGDKRLEDIEFTLPCNLATLNKRYDDTVLDCSRLVKNGEKFTFEPAKTEKSNYVYALLHNARIVPSGIYVPKSMKNKITILKKFGFHDVVADWGLYFCEIYFVRIDLKSGKQLPIHITGSKKSPYYHSLVFSKKGYNISTTKMKLKFEKNDIVEL